jgi:hypothetical protein
MTLLELLVHLLKESGGDCYMQVKVDASIPIPFEDKYEFKYDKGWMLLKEKKE